MCFASAAYAYVDGTNYTQAVLDQPGFPEGLLWVGTNAPSANESASLWNIVTNLSHPSWPDQVEGFFEIYPSSPWAASLHHAYAAFCRRTGRTTKALEHWETGWALASTNSGDASHKVGGMILASWTDQLSSLGRIEKLGELVPTGRTWPFANHQDLERFQGAENSYYLMQMHPEIAFRCGTLALKAVGQALQPGNAALEDLPDAGSPTNGFSLADLASLGQQRGVSLAAVRREAGTELVVPSVIHWQQNHYAAIVAQDETNGFLVVDPTFGRPLWLPADVINEEASGAFLIASGSRPVGWTELSGGEAAAVHGQGLPNTVKDGKDKGCKNGAAKKDCPCAKGMPVWWVSEPYVNLWMADEPISYLTSRGEPFTFRLSYKQRDTRPDDSGSRGPDPGLAPGWNHTWFAYAHVVSRVAGNFPLSLDTSDTTLFLPDGGEVDFPMGQKYDSETGLLLQSLNGSATLQPSSAFFDDGFNGLRLVHADGSQDIYGFVATAGGATGGYAEGLFMLTRRIDPHGNTTWFNYWTYGASPNNFWRLTTVVDADGRTNTLHYSTNGTHILLTQIVNPYGQSAFLRYDQNNFLTNIVDAAGLYSSITYDTNGYPSFLTTPYGTNHFEYTVNSTDTTNNFGGHNLIDRSVRVTEPTSAVSLYLYRYDCSGFMDATFASSDVPTNTPLGTLDDGTGGTNALVATSFRNSFSWDARQYGALSTTNLLNLTANDYLRGRMRHWLQDTNELFLSGLASVERDPSPDGSTEGLKTFYDYQGKIFRHREGTNSLPSVTAWRLPGGETHYELDRYDEFGNITNIVTTYTRPDGSLGTRTNQFLFAENTFTNTTVDVGNGSTVSVNTFTVPNLLTRIVGSDGGTIWSFGGFAGVAWTNDFPIIYSDTNRIILSSQRVLPNSLTNGVNEATALSFTGLNLITGIKWSSGLTTTNLYNSGNFLSRTVDLETGRTNSFFYTTNGLIGVMTNELGLALTPAFDPLLRLTNLAYPDGTYLARLYDKLDVGAARDRLGHWTFFGYDGLQHPNAITNASQAVTRLVWCGCGSLESATDALTNTTTLSRDNQPRLTGILFPDGSSLSYQLDLAGRIIGLADGQNRSLAIGYNDQGLITTVSNAIGLVARIVYDIRDRPSQITDANSITVTNSFDNLDRLLARAWPNGSSESWGYSANGLVSYTDQDGHVTRFARDPAGRLTTVTNGNLEVTRAAYNASGKLTDLWDGLTNHTGFRFNEYGWFMGKTNALGQEVLRLLRDPNGNITNRWTPEFGNTVYSRDALGNVTNVGYLLSTIGYSYDPLNRQRNMTDQVGTTTFTWTAPGLGAPNGRMAAETTPWSGDALNYGYVQGLRTSLSINNPLSTINYAFDQAWRMTNLVSSLAGTFAYAFDAQRSTLLTKITLPNWATITNHFDSLSRLDYAALKNYWGHVLDGYSYQSDPLGLRTNIVRDFGLTNNSVAVGHDGIGQLVLWNAKEADGTPRQNEQLGFNFDKADNLYARTNGGLVQTFNVNGLNELTNVTRTGTLTVSGATPAPATSVTVNGLGAQVYRDLTFASSSGAALINGTNTFTIIAKNAYGLKVTNSAINYLPSTINLLYDSDGNLTNDGTRSFSYSPENQLTNITVAGAWKSDFVHDGLGRRRIERDYTWLSAIGSWQLTNEVRFIYDGFILVQARNTNNNVLVTYTRGLDLSGTLDGAGGIGGLLARTDATNGSTFYHSDGAGNITALIDGRQNIAARYLYGPFGRLAGMWGPLAGANEIQFSSMPRHVNSGLSLFAFRSYDPAFQRWIASDPIGELGGINLYRFVGNNPPDRIDPLGLAGADEDLEREGEITREIRDALRGGRYWNGRYMSDTDLEKLEQEIDKNTKERNEKYEPDPAPPNPSGVPEFRPLIPKGQAKPCPPKAGQGTVPPRIYREGKPNPSNLTPRPKDNGQLSFRDSLSNPWPLEPGQRPVFRPGEPYIAIDTSKLPPGSIIPDNVPVGHVSVNNVPVDALQRAVSEQGKFPK